MKKEKCFDRHFNFKFQKVIIDHFYYNLTILPAYYLRITIKLLFKSKITFAGSD